MPCHVFKLPCLVFLLPCLFWPSFVPCCVALYYNVDRLYRLKDGELSCIVLSPVWADVTDHIPGNVLFVFACTLKTESTVTVSNSINHLGLKQFVLVWTPTPVTHIALLIAYLCVFLSLACCQGIQLSALIRQTNDELIHIRFICLSPALLGKAKFISVSFPENCFRLNIFFRGCGVLACEMDREQDHSVQKWTS